MLSNVPECMNGSGRTFQTKGPASAKAEVSVSGTATCTRSSRDASMAEGWGAGRGEMQGVYGCRSYRAPRLVRGS